MSKIAVFYRLQSNLKIVQSKRSGNIETRLQNQNPFLGLVHGLWRPDICIISSLPTTPSKPCQPTSQRSKSEVEFAWKQNLLGIRKFSLQNNEVAPETAHRINANISPSVHSLTASPTQPLPEPNRRILLPPHCQARCLLIWSLVVDCPCRQPTIFRSCFFLRLSYLACRNLSATSLLDYPCYVSCPAPSYWCRKPYTSHLCSAYSSGGFAQASVPKYKISWLNSRRESTLLSQNAMMPTGSTEIFQGSTRSSSYVTVPLTKRTTLWSSKCRKRKRTWIVRRKTCLPTRVR